MMPQALDENYSWLRAVFSSLTYREQYSAAKLFFKKNTERFEIAACLCVNINIHV